MAAWLQGAGPDPSAEHLCELLERAFAALWARAATTLGTVTLTAIVDRVLVNAAARRPEFGELAVGDDGLDARAFRERLRGAAAAELRAGVELLLVELLTVLGNLTAQILTPALHAALAKVPTSPGRATNDQGAGP